MEMQDRKKREKLFSLELVLPPPPSFQTRHERNKSCDSTVEMIHGKNESYTTTQEDVNVLSCDCNPCKDWYRSFLLNHTLIL